MECYQRDYPRPQFVRAAESWTGLSGQWDFAFDDKNAGLAGGWFRSFPGEKKITVPFTYEYPASGIGIQDRHDIVWYERTVPVTKKPGRRVFLHFEGSDYHTQVWVNGVFAGEHAGGFSRFSFDITHGAKNGENRVTVRVEDSFDISQPRGKQRWKGENFGCWYVQNTGLWKTVWLEYVPETRLEAVKMTPVLSKGLLEIEADLRLPRDAGEDLFLEAEASFEGHFVNRIRVPAKKNRQSFSLDLTDLSIHEWKVRTWAPEHPALYDIKFTLVKNNRVLD